MYLKSIEVQGFKSFANKIVFEFHNGITGIVGPNGSGKSNVGDAVRWVLGEQRAKQLRGNKMEDVIFAGTENRKPLGYAYVAITLDNSDKSLPVDYDEVKVSRRVYRSGESEYLINGSPCRLKDVNELFYDTGIGKEGYSIIGQGQIDKVLSGRPEERRELFDEAAGIVKFKRRKLTAEKKLEEERANLVRVSDILSELKKQVGPLEKQSASAREYLKLKEELKTYDINMFLIEYKRIRDQLADIEKKHEIAKNELEDNNKAHDNAKTEYEKIEHDIALADEEIERTRASYNEATMLKGKLEGEINVLREQINTANQNENIFSERIVSIEAEIKSKSEELSSINSEKDEIQEKLNEILKRGDAARAELESVSSSVREFSEQIENNKNEIIELLNEKSNIKSRMQRYDTMLEQINLRKMELNQKLIRSKSQDDIENDNITKLARELDEVNGRINDMTEEKNDLEDEIEVLVNQLKEDNDSLAKNQQTYHMEKSRLESLRNITERYDGYGNSIRKVMEQKEREPGIIGVVADIVKVDKKYEVAIETALGGSIQNIVTDNEYTAKRLIDFLKKNKLGRATFLPITTIVTRVSATSKDILNETGVIGIASNLVTVESKYQKLAEYLLSRILVVDNIDNALVIAKKYNHSIRIVTLEGESLSTGGSMTGGAFKNSSNLLGRRREIEELENQVSELAKRLEIAKGRIEQNRDNRNEKRAELDKLKESIQKTFIEQNTAKMNYNQAMSKRADIKGQLVAFMAEAKELDGQINDIGELKAGLQIQIDSNDARNHELESDITQINESIIEYRRLEEELSNKNNETNLERANLTQKNDFVHENIRRITRECHKLEEELSGIKSQIDDMHSDVQSKNEKIEELKLRISSTDTDSSGQRESLEEKIKEKEELSRKLKESYTKRENFKETMTNLDKECFRLNSMIEKTNEVLDSKINYIWTEYELTYNKALPLRDESLTNQTEIRTRIDGIKSSIRDLGTVNVNAIEEYKEVYERYEFLSGQYDDLITSENTLLKIIEELDEGMRIQFKEKFAEIRIEFNKVFKELFGGGCGTLELSEDEDVLTAGVQIISQPPGKKLQNMMQLSGGEKALTAIALLFAIQNLKPSPFCLLDEIEAALDDSNVGRFAGYLHKLTENTQFIIITHRRGTMAAADRLYGITMQEKGVSTLVSVNLIENELDA